MMIALKGFDGRNVFVSPSAVAALVEDTTRDPPRTMMYLCGGEQLLIAMSAAEIMKLRIGDERT